MPIFNNYPWSNFHRLNADWLLKKVQEALTVVERVAGEVESWAARIQTLENSRVSYTEQQQLTTEQQQTARNNIGAAPNIGTVRYNVPQTLDDSYKQQARENIGAVGSADLPDVSNVVRTSAQSFTDAQKTQARTNIGAVGSADLPDVSNVVRTSAQSFTDAQKTQARTNIGAAAVGETAAPFIVSVGPDELGTGYISTKTRTEIVDAWEANRVVEVVFTPLNSPDYIITIPINVTTDGDVVAIAFLPEPPTVAINTRWYRLYWSVSNNQESFTVLDNEGRFIPTNTMDDAGKVLTVSANGRPVWANDRYFIITASIDTQSGTVTLESGVTYQSIVNAAIAHKVIQLYATTQAGTLQVFDCGRVSSENVIFNTFSFVSTILYPLFVVVKNNNDANYYQLTLTGST